MAEEVLTDGPLILRRWREADAPTIVDCLDGDPEISRWLDRVPQPYTLADALAYVRGEVPGVDRTPSRSPMPTIACSGRSARLRRKGEFVRSATGCGPTPADAGRRPARSR